ncbi:MAG: translation initiation factor IF-3 [Candidatus Kerfeldbacteria bacterium]|nr:translation initiation factor IF-3 [Candidatus Kerfeldbacteria bacterium]
MTATPIRHVHKPKFVRRNRVNHQIQVPEVRIIDEQGQQLGVMSTSQALATAIERGLDLIEVSPMAQPPVCRIANYGAFLFNLDKKERKQKAKQKKVEIKGIRLTLKIGPHDLENRRRQTAKFLEKGDKAKVEMILRGRERAYADRAQEIMKKFVDDLAQGLPGAAVEKNVSRQGNRLFMIIGLKK